MKKKFTKVQLNKFQKAFEEKKAKILETIASNSSHEIDSDGDEVDKVQGSILNNLTNILSARDLGAVHRLNIALDKIDKGIFGICDGCDELINEKRLMAVPGVGLCVACAEQDELDAKNYSQEA